MVSSGQPCLNSETRLELEEIMREVISSDSIEAKGIWDLRCTAMGVSAWYLTELLVSIWSILDFKTSHYSVFSQIILKNLWFSYLKNVILCIKLLQSYILYALHSQMVSWLSSKAILDKQSDKKMSSLEKVSFPSSLRAFDVLLTSSYCLRQNYLSIFLYFICLTHLQCNQSRENLRFDGDELKEARNLVMFESIFQKRFIMLALVFLVND